jgi:hypothetical protein
MKWLLYHFEFSRVRLTFRALGEETLEEGPILQHRLGQSDQGCRVGSRQYLSFFDYFLEIHAIFLREDRNETPIVLVERYKEERDETERERKKKRR